MHATGSVVLFGDLPCVPCATEGWRACVESMARGDRPATFSRRSAVPSIERASTANPMALPASAPAGNKRPLSSEVAQTRYCDQQNRSLTRTFERGEQANVSFLPDRALALYIVAITSHVGLAKRLKSDLEVA
jgi:hypothetical protein